MEAHLLKFIARVKSQGDGVNDIGSEYDRIKQQNNSMKQKYGLSTKAGEVKDNVKKNRYKDILPYDQSRVCLSPTTTEYSSDYINANFIQGATGNRTYIATQGPLSITVVDFWRMIWQYDVKVIIMACKVIELGKKKCEIYWPSSDETSTFGPFTITTFEESPLNEEVIVRTLAVKYCDETRMLSQFQYTAWPDHGIPNKVDGILGMMQLANSRQGSDPGPMLIHCSAGCGRTGVICAIDYVNDLLHEKKIGADFSIMDIVLDLRRQRPSAVQTKDQYVFVFQAVAQMFEKVLQIPTNTSKYQNNDSGSLYSNVGPPNPATRSLSISSDISVQKPRRPPPLQPRPSHQPLPSGMNDTYAVVNKPKPSPSPLHLHHYDNDHPSNQVKPTNDLYSVVKPKNTVPIYSRPLQAHQRPNVPSSEMENDGYEPLPGNFCTREFKPCPPVKQGPLEKSDDDDDDDGYEYVQSPVSNSSNSSYCSAGGMGFKCRIKKPKGPRDPPPQWKWPER